MRLRIKVGLNQSRTWSTTTVSVNNQYIKRKKWHQHGVKTGGHSLIRDPHSGSKVGSPLTPGPHRIAATVSRQEILIIWTHIYLWSLSSKLGLVFYRQFTEREFRSVINGIDAPIVTCQFCCLVQPLNSTLLNRELRTQVSDTMSASSLYTSINKQYHFMTFSDRFPVPVR